MAIKKFILFYFTNIFLWWGILLAVSGHLRGIQEIEQFRDSLWAEQWFFWIFWIIFGIALIQSLFPLEKQRKEFPRGSEERKSLAFKAGGIGMVLGTEAVAFVITIFDLWAIQEGKVPNFQAYHNWLGIIFVLNYIFVPFCLGLILHGPKISKWVQKSPHREDESD